MKRIGYLTVLSLFGVAGFGPHSLPKAKQDGSATITSPLTQARFWVLVHADDAAASSRMLTSKDIGTAAATAKDLGYEPIRESEGVFFFPIPALTAGVGNTLSRLLARQSKNGYDSEIDTGEFTPNEREHLTSFLHRYAGQSIRGELGTMIQNSKLGPMRLTMQVDMKVESGGEEYSIPLMARDLGKWLNVKPEFKHTNAPEEPTFVRRKELYGLGSRAFSITLRRSTN